MLLNGKYKNNGGTMVKNIVKGEHVFSKKAQPATEADKQVITDLLDTLRANKNVCVGMAANMIGINKAIIAVSAGPFHFAMVNPVITKKLKWIIWIRISKSSMANIQDGQHRLFSTKLIIAMVL